MFAEKLPLVIGSCCDSTVHCITYPYNFPNLNEVRCCNYEPNCVASITDVTSGDAAYCISYLTDFVWNAIRSYCDTPTIPSTCLAALVPSALQVLQVLVLYNILTSLKESIIAVFFLRNCHMFLTSIGTCLKYGTSWKKPVKDKHLPC